MNNEIEVTEVVEELVEEKPEKQPKKQQKPKQEKQVEDVLVDVLFTKVSAVDGKLYKIHDTAKVHQSKLDKLPAKSYLVRKVK